MVVQCFPGLFRIVRATRNMVFAIYIHKSQQGKAAILCKVVRDEAARSFGLRVAAKCTVSTPSTNRPFPCPVAGCHLFVWSHQLVDHFRTAHSSLPDTVTGPLAAIRHHEREYLRPFLTRNKSKLKRCSVQGCPCRDESLPG